MTALFLDQAAKSSEQTGTAGGALVFTILNFGQNDIVPARFVFTGVARPLAPPNGTPEVTGGRFVDSVGTLTTIALDSTIPASGRHEITMAGLAYPATGRMRGAITAWLELKDGTALPLEVGEVAPPTPQDASPPALPDGVLDVPLGLLPWPAQVTICEWLDTPRRYAPADATTAAAMGSVAALHRRLFPTHPAPFAMIARDGMIPIETTHDQSVAPGAYRLRFGARVSLTHSDTAGLRHGLLTLAQIGHAALSDANFRQPKRGEIADAPRFGWRGCHFDVARHFHDVATVKRLLDIMAWLKMNQFHWHGTEDEGWRFPSRAFQSLGALATERLRGTDMLPQYGDGPEGSGGAYSFNDVAEVISHASASGIDVMPEIEVPGHSAALLNAVNGLRDIDEVPDSYRSVQGFPNNALNPALDRTYEVVEAILRETAETFPGPVIHVGADEVDLGAWTGSPAVQTLAKEQGLTSTMAVQAYFLRRVQKMLHGMGKTFGGWDECAEGGGIEAKNTILFAWRSKEKTAELIEHGYDVVATPGQAYYLDMIQRGGWDGFGIAWAGLADPETTYRYDPADGLPDGPGRLLGVQAGIWTEYLPTRRHLNAMMHPRFGAIAEAGWTEQASRDWLSFCARRHLVPEL